MTLVKQNKKGALSIEYVVIVVGILVIAGAAVVYMKGKLVSESKGGITADQAK